MGRVPAWDEVHGWHRFVPSSFQGEDWCAICDCLIDDHTPYPPEGKIEVEVQTHDGAKYTGCR